MSFLTRPGEGPSFPYAGQPLHVLAGDNGQAGPGSMFTAPRGSRHGFSNPFAEDALVLGIWAPAGPALAFMREIGAALSPGTRPDPGQMRELYLRHASHLMP
jgi:hypothetical protein